MSNFKKFLALMLAVVMLICLVACDSKKKDNDTEEEEETVTEEVKTEEKEEEEESDSKKEDKKTEDSIDGEWVMEFDCGEALFASAGMDDMDAPKQKVTAELAMEFDDDEFTLNFSIDEKKLAKYLEELIDIAIEYLCEENDVTEAELEEQVKNETGKTLEEYFDEILGEAMESAAEELSGSLEGYFKVDGKKVYIAEDKDDLDDEETYFEFTIKGDTMTIKEFVEDGESEEDPFGIEDMGGEVPYELERK